MATFPPNESELVDQFIDALWRDPQAQAPIGLDADLAEFVRTLAHAEQVGNRQEIQARVWQKSLVRARATRYRQQQNSNVTSGATPMISVLPKPKNDHKAQRGNIATIAFLATTAVLAFAISTSAFRQPSPFVQPASNGGLVQAEGSPTPTAIPSATWVPTATPFLTVANPVSIQASQFPPTVPPVGFQVVPSPVNCDVTVTTGTLADMMTATPIANIATCPGLAVLQPAGMEIIQLDLRTLKEQKFSSPAETTGEITKDDTYAYFVYESTGDQNLDVVLTSARSTDANGVAVQPDFSLIIFDQIDSVAYGIVMVPKGGDMFKSPNVYFDADSGAGKDPELNNIPFRKGHKYGIYVMQGKPNQFGKFTIRLNTSTDN